ncbi:MAG: outer membrane lipoprotein carrier protein LolA [bacterium]|jgi:outer membrane lipoprotein-sorting protein|nr:outer membrane lipoprotein carrier protein LolA [candidate division KSB1 bacterium]MDH7559845.1 outer membrane lipoprotein carrier protein LolA [bacterium]
MFRRLYEMAVAVLVATSSLSLPAEAQQLDGQAVVRKVRATFESLKSMRARFTQIFEWKLVGESQKTSGSLAAAKGDCYRIETDDQLIVTDGKTVWNYSKANKQVIIDELGKTADAPLMRDLMLRYAEGYTAVLKGQEAIGGSDCYVVELRPKGEEFITAVTLWVDGKLWIPLRVRQMDVNDNVNLYELQDVELNVTLAGSLFTFQPPAEAEVIDMR